MDGNLVKRSYAAKTNSDGSRAYNENIYENVLERAWQHGFMLRPWWYVDKIVGAWTVIFWYWKLRLYYYTLKGLRKKEEVMKSFEFYLMRTDGLLLAKHHCHTKSCAFYIFHVKVSKNIFLFWCRYLLLFVFISYH